MSKFIIFSDIHLNNWSGPIDAVERISQRLLDQKSVLQQLIDLAVENDAVLLNGGDTFHAVGAVPTEALNVYSWFLNEIRKCGLRYYAVSGNHDQTLRKNLGQWHDILNLFQDKQQRNKELSEMKVRFVDYDEEDIYSIKDNDIVVLHKQPACSNKYGFKHEGVDWKKIAKNNRLCFYGHFHETKKLGPTSFVIGQPLQMTQSDVGEERGCWLVNSEDWKVEFIKLDYPELKKIEKIEAKEEKIEERIKATSFNDILLEWLAHENKDNSYLELIKNDLQDKIQVNKSFFKGKIDKIYVKDFLSFEEITFEFKNGFWLVLGENGVGKTTLFESILWLLFDDTTKQLAKNEVIRNRPTKQKDAYGELSLVDDKSYTLKRSVKNGLEVICEGKNLVEGMTKIQAQEFLEKNILGFDKNTYLASCYFSQEGLLTLAQLGSADSTNLVTNLLGFETYDSLHNLMVLKAKEMEANLLVLDQDKQKLDNEIWKNSEQQKNVKEQIEMFTKQECSLKDEHLKVNQQLSEFNDLLVKIVIPEVSVTDLEEEIQKLNAQKTELSTKQQMLQIDGQKKINAIRTKGVDLQNKLRFILTEQGQLDKQKTVVEATNKEIQQQIQKIDKYLEQFQNKETKLCPLCGNKMDEEHFIAELSKKQTEKNELNNQIKEVPDVSKQLESLYDQEATNQEEIQTLEEEIKKVDAENQQIYSANNAEIKVVEDKIKDVQKKKEETLKVVTLANSSKVSLTQQIKQLEQRSASLLTQLQGVNIDDKLLQLKDLENKLIVLNNQTTVLKDRTSSFIKNKEIYEFWANAFSNKGIRPLLLDRFVNEFNKIVIKYCYKVSNGEWIVQFNPTSKTRAGLERNKLDLEILYKNKTAIGLSGGEQTRINLPLCLALNEWVSKKYKILNGLLNIIILDEVFCYTDNKFRDNVAELLNEEGQTKSIYCIDHSQTLIPYTQNLLQIIKENEITNIQVI